MKKIIVLLFIAFSAHAQKCAIYYNNRAAPDLKDALYWVLTTASECPTSVLPLEKECRSKGMQYSSSMVANRGHQNPIKGSFSFFEMARGKMPDGSDGEIFIGHFTRLANGNIVLDQTPSPDKLLIEAIAWDDNKQLYNFYELLGQEHGDPKWFYRGDSQDALLDNRYLHRIPNPGEEKFGRRMRCSACHNNGTPIMKELSFPHNDWWTETRPLIFGRNRLSKTVSNRVLNLSSAEHLAQNVLIGMQKIHQSNSYKQVKSKQSFIETMRPLFCPTEINLVSSDKRLKGPETEFLMPPESLLHPLLGSPQLVFSKQEYQQLLNRHSIKFPETNEMDADHMWLTPVVSMNDRLAIEELIADEIITEKIAKDILMIDFKNPLFSDLRCGLLGFIPHEWSTFWLEDFLNTLANQQNPIARTLATNIEDLFSDERIHQPLLQEYATYLSRDDAKEQLFDKLLRQRKQVSTSELSQNPLGEILEPGFRVIFPLPLSDT
jgi:hypothetical protein